MSIKAGPFPYENVTRMCTTAERAQIEGVKLDDADIERLVDAFRNSLTQNATTASSAAVQNGAKIFTELTLRMSRNVQSEDGKRVEQLISRETIEGQIGFEKIFKN